MSTLSCVPEPAQLERRTTELLQRLIRFNTVNPPGNEQAAQEFLRDTLAAAGFECELLSAVEGRPNLIARLRGEGDGPTLCLCGHVDTVLADPKDWSLDPWSGELKDGCVWGRGALDMKSQVAAEVAAAEALAQEGWRPSGELLVVITADEEVGARVRRAVAVQRARRQGPLRLHGQRGRRRDRPLRRPPRLRRVRRREGRLPVHDHHARRGGARVDPAHRRQRADEARAAAAGDARPPALARAQPGARVAAHRPGHRPVRPGGRDPPGGARPIRASPSWSSRYSASRSRRRWRAGPTRSTSSPRRRR